MAGDSWAQVFHHGARKGGGVLLTSRLVVTAAHCVKDVALADPAAALAVSVSDRPLTDAILVDLAKDSDLALLEVRTPLAGVIGLPRVSRSAVGDMWVAPCRPDESFPHLGGNVRASLLYKCQAGATIAALQLTSDTELGNYQGYSGGPVYRSPESLGELLGILIEQYPDHADPSRSTTTLFAAAIEGALELFPSLQNAYLLRLLLGTHESTQCSAPEPAPRPIDRLGDPQENDLDYPWILAKLVEGFLDRQALLDPELRPVHQAFVSDRIMRYGAGGENV